MDTFRIQPRPYSLIWPHYISSNGVPKEHYMRLCPRVSSALNVQSLCGARQGTFFLRFYCVFPCASPSPLPLHLHFSTLCWEVQGSRLIPASLPAGTSPPAGLRHGTGRSLGSRNWINSGKLQQELHQLSNGSALPCTSSSIFQPNSQEKAREQIYDKTALFAVQKKTWTIFWFHAHRDST